jgi:16S rRNA (adenine1518-N6/adenine1519-N6)-dimethyltransferase
MSPSDGEIRTGPVPIRKSLGQHFLSDKRILQRIVDALELTGEETVIEIGPGRGSLTALLVPVAKRLVLVEVDRTLAARLREKYARDPHVTVVEADVLTVNLGELAAGPFRLVGNIPYNITTPILFHALERPRPDRAVYLVQKEVGDRIAATPGSDHYGALSVNVQALANPKSLFRVGAGAFNPPPKVDSAVVRIDPRPDPVISESEEKSYQRFVIDAFGMRRKQLRRALRSIWNLPVDVAEEILAECNLDPTVRPETLTPSDFARLLRARK